tara:strand:- start:526 stop:804 length:279 start_codon:yes stop_codon:yes gene_type:complete
MQVNIDITHLVEPPTLEEELTMERRILDLNECNDVEELRRCCAAAYRQNHHQAHFVSRCLEEIALLQARIACLKNPVKQPERNWIQNLFYGK